MKIQPLPTLPLFDLPIKIKTIILVPKNSKIYHIPLDQVLTKSIHKIRSLPLSFSIDSHRSKYGGQPARHIKRWLNRVCTRHVVTD